MKTLQIEPTEVTKFVVGETYAVRSSADYDCVFKFTIVRRTDKSVWIDYHGDVSQKRIMRSCTHRPGYKTDWFESIWPLGSGYSGSPLLRATDHLHKITGR